MKHLLIILLLALLTACAGQKQAEPEPKVTSPKPDIGQTVVAEESTMPDPADVRATNAKLQELMDLLDGKAKWDDA